MRAYVYLLALLIWCACGAPEKETVSNENTEVEVSDTTTVVDTLPVDSSSVPEEKPYENISAHHQSEWGKKNSNHPAFHSKRVDEWTDTRRKMTVQEERQDFYEYDLLKASQLKQLHVSELVYYCLSYPCSYSQICAIDDFIDSIPGPKIKARIPYPDNGLVCTELQRQFLNRNRDSVIILFSNALTSSSKRVDIEWLQMLYDLDGAKSIPAVLKTANVTNLYNYSFLVMMMEKHQYQPFMDTELYTHFYGPEAYQYGNRAFATKENMKLIADMAMGMYKQGGK